MIQYVESSGSAQFAVRVGKQINIQESVVLILYQVRFILSATRHHTYLVVFGLLILNEYLVWLNNICH